VTVPRQPVYDLFSPPPEPPTGPPTDLGKFARGSEARYQAWKATDAGWKAWRYIERTALDLAARGEARISLQFCIEQAREHVEPHASVNHNFRSLICRDLLARHPHLVDRIERRKRREAA